MAYAQHGTDIWGRAPSDLADARESQREARYAREGKSPAQTHSMDAIRSHGHRGNFELAWDRFARQGGSDPARLDALTAAMLFGWFAVCVMAGAAIVLIAMHL